MPYVNIKLLGGEYAPTVEQKAALIKGATQLLVDTLGKNPATTIVVIEEIPADAWGIGGESAAARRAKAK